MKETKGLKLIGDPKLCICAFTSDKFNIYQLLSGELLKSARKKYDFL